jgi:hypothetical protein
MSSLLIKLLSADQLNQKREGGTWQYFVIFSNGTYEAKSSAAKASQKPTWNQQLLLPLDLDKPIVLEVFRQDNFGNNHQMGRASVHFQGLAQNKPTRRSFKLPTRGIVYTEMTAIGFGRPPSPGCALNQMLIVNVLEIANVVNATGHKMLDLFVRVTVGDKEQQTSVAKKQQRPAWHEILCFEGTELEEARIQLIELYSGYEYVIGTYSLTTTTLFAEFANPLVPKWETEEGEDIPEDSNVLRLIMLPCGYGEVRTPRRLAKAPVVPEFNLTAPKSQFEGTGLRRKSMDIASQGALHLKRLAYQQQQLKVTVVEAVGEINNMESMRAVTRIHFRDSQAETFEYCVGDHPFWNESYTFPYYPDETPLRTTVTFDFCDQDRVLGQASYDTSMLYDSTQADLFLPVRLPGDGTTLVSTVQPGTNRPQWGETFEFELGVCVDRDLEVCLRSVWERV